MNQKLKDFIDGVGAFLFILFLLAGVGAWFLYTITNGFSK